MLPCSALCHFTHNIDCINVPQSAVLRFTKSFTKPKQNNFKMKIIAEKKMFFLYEYGAKQ